MENTPLLLDAGDVARDRLNRYLAEKLDCASNATVWEFYTFLLKQAQKHEPDRSFKQMHLAAYKEDEAASKKIWEEYRKSWGVNENNKVSSPQSDNTRRGEQT